jgi:hypothetical protein
MNEQVIAFLLKYQEMRKTQSDYFKNRKQGTLIRSKQLELDLDKTAAQLLAVLNPDNHGQQTGN